ncbi:Beta-lactamase domain-containing protein 2 [Fasciola hepatica]|uniref:Beta-lactamase domain-containing protein 2 n=1 Tax=Fasciola hepatica TaxID=6192 RepID=A0A4E0RFL9_FASHE|nr:Beta-lactamase domain-containing protein 2 [Fasciola hepatica]
MFTFKDAIILGLLCTISGFVYFTWTVLPPKMDGTSVFTFRHAVHAYRNLIQSGAESGSSFSVYRENGNVLNVFGGYTDKRFRLAWTQDTVTQTFTLGLLSVSFTFALLVQRSLVNLNDPLVKYIPTFSATQVTISDLLTHQAGFPYFIDPVHLSVWRDDYMTVVRNITHQVPSKTPKTRIFHVHSLALLADAIVRKADPKHRTLAHFFMEEITWPLGVDILIGIPRSQAYRMARTYHADLTKFLSTLFYLDFGYLWLDLQTAKSMPYGSDRDRAMQTFTDYDLIFNLNPDLLEVPLPSSHLFTNARALARLFTILLSPENDTVPSNSNPFHTNTVKQLLQIHPDAKHKGPTFDPVLQRYVQFTVFGLMVAESPEETPLYGMWDDILGQMVFVDPHRRITVAYTTNHAHGRSLKRDFIIRNLLDATYQCLFSESDYPKS